jgi:cytochrome c556
LAGFKKEHSMRRFLLNVVALAVAFGGVALVAQKVSTPADLDAAMKRIAPAQGATGKAIQSGAFADAKASVATVKQALIDSDNFWTAVVKKEDAIALSKDAIAKVTALEQALSAPTPDPQAVLAAQKQVGGTCGGCHKQYREQDANMQYQLKAGTL